MKKTIISKIIIEVGLIDLFIFLDKKGYLDAFLNNTYHHLGDFKSNEFSSMPDRWIAQAFVWNKSPEGWKVWSELAEEWKAYLLEGISEEDVIEWRITSAK